MPEFLAFPRRSRHIPSTMRGKALVLVVLLAGCGGAEPTPIVPSTAPSAAPAPPTGPLVAKRPPAGALFRDEVNALVDQGFPQFLQRVDVEPRLVDGQFRGWSIVALNPAEFWKGVDLKPGDIVTRVNDLPIERETEAFDAFESLKQSDSLRVAMQRDGQPRLLEYKIVSK